MIGTTSSSVSRSQPGGLWGSLHVVHPRRWAAHSRPPPSARCRDHASLQRGVHELRELVGAFEACSQKAVELLIEQAAVKDQCVASAPLRHGGCEKGIPPFKRRCGLSYKLLEGAILPRARINFNAGATRVVSTNAGGTLLVGYPCGGAGCTEDGVIARYAPTHQRATGHTLGWASAPQYNANTIATALASIAFLASETPSGE